MSIICPRCGELNDEDKAEQCPHCGVFYAKARQAKNPGYQPRPASNMPTAAATGGGGTLLIGIVVVAIFAMSDCGGSSDTHTVSAERQARDLCREQLRYHVRHPSTLSVSAFGITQTTLNNGNHLIRIPFSASNSFGVELDYNARCQTNRQGTEIIGFNTVER
ncbi:hypothetical protein [Thioalkalivibrio sp. ALM2T]|uniref:hypothetical protein n=1 Tax=Thioalkalivibrio sp. ALM2T TaxID=1158184 RepID=UPI0012DD0145|nr:hypothetical protein [Thioalkalivibrio sp. ALM2T]